MFSFVPNSYGAVFAPLLDRLPLCELGPGTPHLEVQEKLDNLDIKSAFDGRKISDNNMALCSISGLWLLYNFLDHSHTISQSIHTTTGSYWHGIMHRREPDFSNSKYWFHRVAAHPIYEPLCQSVQKLVQDEQLAPNAEFLALQKVWDPMKFIDFCKDSLPDHSQSNLLCRKIAQLEWQILFDYCYNLA